MRNVGTEDNEIKTRFYKHRMNMLLLSGIFVFLVLSGGTVEKFNVLGSSISFDNPDVPLNIFFICMIYMLIKYFQYLSEMGGTGIKGLVKSMVQQKVSAVAKSIDDKKIGEDSGLQAQDYNIIRYIDYFTYGIKVDSARSGRATEAINGQHGNILSDEHIIGFNVLWNEYLKSFLFVLFRTVWFAEYILPILLAISGIVLYFFPNIAPSIVWNMP